MGCRHRETFLYANETIGVPSVSANFCIGQEPYIVVVGFMCVLDADALQDVLADRHCFILQLVPTRELVYVHPITDGGDVFLPCTYGYATTIRRAQGSTLDMGAVYFDHCYPPERGYAYVAVSRFREARFVYHFGKLRRSDWLPVGSGEDALEQTMRSNESAASDDEWDRSSYGGSDTSESVGERSDDQDFFPNVIP